MARRSVWIVTVVVLAMSVNFADAHGFIAVAPEFTATDFEGSARYNLGYVFDPDTGERRDQADWTFSAIEPLFDQIVEWADGQQQTDALFGHSAGSQFARRFLHYIRDAWRRFQVAHPDRPRGRTLQRADDACVRHPTHRAQRTTHPHTPAAIDSGMLSTAPFQEHREIVRRRHAVIKTGRDRWPNP